MAVLALQGCVKEYTNALPGEEQPTPEQPVVEDDDMVTLLKSIQGVSDVEMKMVPFANGSTIANYFFNYEQLVDQFDEKKGTFKQRIAMQLADSSAPVIVHTLGYAMTMEGKFAVEEHLKQFLNANWVEIEYRYFGNSLPEPLEDMNLTYLYSDQAAVDIHNDSAAAETNPNIVMVLNPGGIHETDFLNLNSFTKESSELIQTWTKAFLGLQ